jgi:predicted oxidoreductase
MSLIDPSPRSLGPFEVGQVAFGTWRFVGDATDAGTHLLEIAIEHGCNLVDCADVYGFDWGGTGFGTVEQALGDVLAGTPSLRDRIVLATKGGIMPGIPYDQSADYVRSAVDASLERLRVEVIDVYQIHRPDLFTHPAELAATLAELRDAGKIREVGVSNFTPAQVSALQAHLPFPIVSTQPQFSALHLDPMFDGTFDQCLELGIAPMAWSPLAGGALATGDGVPSELLAVLDRLAEREGADRGTIALAFTLAHPSRPISIIGTMNPDRIVSSVGATRVNLDRSDCYDIVEASRGEPMP